MINTLSFGRIQTHFSNYPFIYLRFLLPVVVLALMAGEDTRLVVVGVLSDAFFQVAVFVAATLAIFHGFKHLTQHRFKHWLAFAHRHEVLTAALLGALPGCGGAIIVVTRFVRGETNFGAIVAVLTATMGDAAFVLLAAKPMDGLMISALGIVVGTASGYLVNAIFGEAYLRPSVATISAQLKCKPKQNSARLLWQWLLVPCLAIGLLMAFQVDVANLLALPQGTIEILGAVFAFIAIALWSLSSTNGGYQELVAEDDKETSNNWFNDVAHDTNFVLSWVIAAFLLFELLVLYTGISLGNWLGVVPALTPFLAILVGILPGCGPQIIVTTLYIEGQIPFSAQIGNAISNDGDALFPAIALAPKAALLATFFSTIPAVIVAYGYFLIFE